MRRSNCRDGDKARYLGKGVRRAVDAVDGEIFDAISGMDAEDQVQIDETMIDARRHAQQGAARRQRLARRLAGYRQGGCGDSVGLPLYRYVGGAAARVLPVPMMNIVNGGAHADNPIDFQEFMVMPVGADSFAEALRMGAEIFPHPRSRR